MKNSKGRVLLISSLSGSSSYLEALLESVDKSYYLIAAEGKGLEYFRSKNIEVNYILENIRDISDAISSASPATVASVCQYTNTLDKTAILIAKQKNIPAVMLVDHWDHFRNRVSETDLFSIEIIDKYLPDYMVVSDETAKELAVKEGVSKDIILPLGNPVIERQINKKLNPDNKSQWKEKIDIKGNKIITFVSEIFRDHNLINNYGFDEFNILESILRSMPDDYCVNIKLHPNESYGKYAKYLRKTHISESKIDSIDNIVSHSDKIIGMGSMLLMEAAVHRKDILTYRPGCKIPFIGDTIGWTTPVKDEIALKHYLNNNAYSREKDFSFYKNSGARINSFLTELCKGK